MNCGELMYLATKDVCHHAWLQEQPRTQNDLGVMSHSRLAIGDWGSSEIKRCSIASR
jgi:hypothetical protein